MLLSKFEIGKLYKFSKEKYLIDSKNRGERGHFSWVNECENKRVVVLNEEDGITDLVYLTSPKWCVEVEDDNSRDEG